MLRAFGTLAFVTALAACGTASPPSSPPPSSAPSSPTPGSPPPSSGAEFDERQACAVDEDCVPVEIECCDVCNGGAVIGVHRDHAAEIRRTYAGPDECRDVACTEMACVEQPTGICRQGVCGTRVGAREDVSPLPPP